MESFFLDTQTSEQKTRWGRGGGGEGEGEGGGGEYLGHVEADVDALHSRSIVLAVLCEYSQAVCALQLARVSPERHEGAVGDGAHDGAQASDGGNVAALGPEVPCVHHICDYHLHLPLARQLHLYTHVGVVTAKYKVQNTNKSLINVYNSS